MAISECVKRIRHLIGKEPPLLPWHVLTGRHSSQALDANHAAVVLGGFSPEPPTSSVADVDSAPSQSADSVDEVPERLIERTALEARRYVVPLEDMIDEDRLGAGIGVHVGKG